MDQHTTGCGAGNKNDKSGKNDLPAGHQGSPSWTGAKTASSRSAASNSGEDTGLSNRAHAPAKMLMATQVIAARHIRRDQTPQASGCKPERMWAMTRFSKA